MASPYLNMRTRRQNPRNGKTKIYLAECPVCIHGFSAQVDLRRHLLEHVLSCESEVPHDASATHLDLSTRRMPYKCATPKYNPYRILRCVLLPRRVAAKYGIKVTSWARRVHRKRPYKAAVKHGLHKRRASQRLEYESTAGSDGEGGDWEPNTGYGDHQDPPSDTTTQQYRCSVCKTVYSDRGSCQTHILTHIENSAGPGLGETPIVTDGAPTKLYRCSVCEMLFNDRVMCEQHVADHSTQDIALETSMTDDHPTSAGNTTASEAEKSSGEKTTKLYRCSVCKSIFDDRLSCELHAQTHSVQASQDMSSDDKPTPVGLEELQRCSVCKKIFDDKMSCEKHMESHTLKPPFESKGDSGLLREILTRTSDQVKIIPGASQKLYRCSICKEIFKDVASCQRHTATHHLKPLKCVLCDKDCNDKLDLMLHMGMIHPQVKFVLPEGEAGQLDYGVEVADTTHTLDDANLPNTQDPLILAGANTELPTYEEVTDVQIKSEYDTEMASRAAEAGGEEFTDSEIAYVATAKKTTSVSHVQIVYAKVEESSEDALDCNVCGRSLKTKKALANHIAAHPTCNECGERFKNKEMMIKHMRVSHKSKCEVCGNVYNSQARLRMHMKSHTTGEWPPKCDICGQVFSKERELARHVFKHTNEYPHLCDQCGTGFVDKSKLIRHMQKHLQEKKHQCSECGKRFNDKGVMKRHMLIHTGEKPYICHRCGRAFREQTTLRNHLKRPVCTDRQNLVGEEWRKAHGMEPAVCHICGEVCKSKRSLRNHVRKHSGVKPQVFPCEVCLDAFTTRGALTTHQRTCTSLEPGQV